MPPALGSIASQGLPSSWTARASGTIAALYTLHVLHSPFLALPLLPSLVLSLSPFLGRWLSLGATRWTHGTTRPTLSPMRPATSCTSASTRSSTSARSPPCCGTWQSWRRGTHQVSSSTWRTAGAAQELHHAVHGSAVFQQEQEQEHLAYSNCLAKEQHLVHSRPLTRAAVTGVMQSCNQSSSAQCVAVIR